MLKHMKKPLYFLHIPKTAGTSVVSALDTQFDVSDIAPYQLWNQYLPASKSWKRLFNKHPMGKYSLVRGHFGYGVWREMGQKPNYITMLRDPEERVLSFYRHIQWHISNVGEPGMFFTGDDKPLSEMLSSDTAHFSNFQSKFLGLDLNIKQIAKDESEKESRRFKNMHAMPEFYDTKVPADKLASLAKTHLDEFSFVGIKEHFEESMILLHHKMGWEYQSVNKENVSPKQTETGTVTDEDREVIRKINSADTQVYDYALSKFQTEVLSMLKLKLEVDLTWSEYKESKDEILKKLKA